ncbi:MAG: hypothetical protein B7Y43_04570 [Sphingomonas sp. 28-62-20]|uniref:methyltransferase domain-containing protein n=1 Tax=Sphingomonas sp. 28-62-20 TaxID=1970433 RepID=UPI000BD16152|nr:MAG: hypothetical protein B7Y43_04570 [Sphingomonas sp. 28-62-20]
MIESVEAWSDYWAESVDGCCLTRAPVALKDSLLAIWRDLANVLPNGASILDVAAGGGAVGVAINQGRPDLTVTGVDSAAVGDKARALGVLGGIAADALPFGDGCFDAVTSQFGIEYCPVGSIAEAVRVAAAGAQLRFICHHADSRAVRHNRDRCAAMMALFEAGLFALAHRVAHGAPEDETTVATIDAACQAYRQQSIVEELPLALSQALRSRQPIAMVDWITTKARREVARLQAMVQAALDVQDVERMVGDLTLLGADCAARLIMIDGDEPVAWLISGSVSRSVDAAATSCRHA